MNPRWTQINQRSSINSDPSVSISGSFVEEMTVPLFVVPIQGAGVPRLGCSMDLRLRRLCPGVQEVEIAPLVGLCDAFGKQRPVTSLIPLRRLHPFGLSSSQFFIAHF